MHQIYCIVVLRLCSSVNCLISRLAGKTRGKGLDRSVPDREIGPVANIGDRVSHGTHAVLRHKARDHAEEGFHLPHRLLEHRSETPRMAHMPPCETGYALALRFRWTTDRTTGRVVVGRATILLDSQVVQAVPGACQACSKLGSHVRFLGLMRFEPSDPCAVATQAAPPQARQVWRHSQSRRLFRI